LLTDLLAKPKAFTLPGTFPAGKDRSPAPSPNADQLTLAGVQIRGVHSRQK